MDISLNTSLSPHDLARRWNKSEMAIRLASAVGLGPQYVKVDGELRYALDEVQKYERTRQAGLLPVRPCSQRQSPFLSFIQPQTLP